MNRRTLGKEPIIALRISRAAAAIDVSEPYLHQAIKEGRLKTVTKRARDAKRCVKLIMVDELIRFASTDEGEAIDRL